jgi:glucokinase
MKLVADIGGTHARFAVLDAAGLPTQIQNLKTADYVDLARAMAAYADGVDDAQPMSAVAAVISIAAPLSGDRVQMTNAAWDFSILKTERDLGLHSLRLINDFEALALAVPTLQSDELMAIGHALPQDALQTKAIIGPGTGLGMAGVMPVMQGHQTAWHAIPCEGGHASMAPTTAREAALLQAVWHLEASAKGARHMCWEDFLSGTGLPLLHRAVCLVDGFAYQPLTPAQMGEAALVHADTASLATLRTFCDMLGGAAGDLALMTGARGGVYIKGGVLDRVLELSPDFLQTSNFRERFLAKGAYRAYMQSIPTWFITAPQIALRGCATLL